jgi:hypothetical protein
MNIRKDVWKFNPQSSDLLVRDIKRWTQKEYSNEEEIPIVIEEFWKKTKNPHRPDPIVL